MEFSSDTAPVGDTDIVERRGTHHWRGTETDGVPLTLFRDSVVINRGPNVLAYWRFYTIRFDKV